jgi:hypothetical protein
MFEYCLLPDRISWRINNIHPGGAEVTQQQEAVPPPSTALPDLRLARQISVSGIVRLAILGATSIGSKGSWSRHIDIVRMLRALLAVQLPYSFASG